MAIYVATHKNTLLPNSDWLVPLGLNGYRDETVTISDADGPDSIAHLNSSYCELTGLHWLLRNCRDDYVGLCQYRRYLTFAHFPAHEFYYPSGMAMPATPETMEFLGSEQQKTRMLELLQTHDFILPRALVYQQTVAGAFTTAHGQVLWDQFLRSCRDELGFDTRYFRHETRFYLGNMFVTHGPLFTDFAEALFKVVDAVVAALGDLDETDGSRYAQHRYPGYIAERFIGFYVHQMRMRVFEAPIIWLE